MRVFWAFVASLIVGWTLGTLLLDSPMAWPLVAAMVTVGPLLPFASRLGGEEATKRDAPGRGVWGPR